MNEKIPFGIILTSVFFFLMAIITPYFILKYLKFDTLWLSVLSIFLSLSCFLIFFFVGYFLMKRNKIAYPF
ncbi:hypothetical protein J4477_00840, partial [Candidatus Pacearchaeota archaeon]|nr:hypothetical protein [Candidatus Pacearchaeota archaeon]